MSQKITVPGESGVLTEFEIISETVFSVRRVQDVNPIIERNKFDQNDAMFNNGYSPDGDLKHVARIPVVILEEWAKEAGIPRNQCLGPKMNEIIKKKLNDPDNEFLRTGKGKI